MDYQLIKQLCQKKDIRLEELSEKIGMSRTGMSTSFRNNTLKVENLEKIAEILDVSPSEFFNQTNADKEREGKFEYLKTSVLSDKNIIIDFRGKLGFCIPKVGFSEGFISLLKANVNQKESNELLNPHLIQTFINTPKSLEDLISGNACNYFEGIKKHIETQGNPELTARFNIEKQILYIRFVDQVLADESIKFLLKEELIEKTNLLAAIDHMAFNSFEIRMDDKISEYLSQYFDITAIRFVKSFRSF